MQKIPDETVIELANPGLVAFIGEDVRVAKHFGPQISALRSELENGVHKKLHRVDSVAAGKARVVFDLKTETENIVVRL